VTGLKLGGEKTAHLPSDVLHFGEVPTYALSREAGVHNTAELSVSVPYAVLRTKSREMVGTVPCASTTFPYPNKKFAPFSCVVPVVKSGLLKTYFAVRGSEMVRRVIYSGINERRKLAGCGLAPKQPLMA
jgi:hypothetical protein